MPASSCISQQPSEWERLTEEQHAPVERIEAQWTEHRISVRALCQGMDDLERDAIIVAEHAKILGTLSEAGFEVYRKSIGEDKRMVLGLLQPVEVQAQQASYGSDEALLSRAFSLIGIGTFTYAIVEDTTSLARATGSKVLLEIAEHSIRSTAKDVQTLRERAAQLTLETWGLAIGYEAVDEGKGSEALDFMTYLGRGKHHTRPVTLGTVLGDQWARRFCQARTKILVSQQNPLATGPMR